MVLAQRAKGWSQLAQWTKEEKQERNGAISLMKEMNYYIGSQ
jgi:hypothetical protein